MKAWREASSFSLATTSNTILAIVTEAVKKATSACVIGEHFADAIAGVVREHRVRLLVVRERDQASPQRPAAMRRDPQVDRLGDRTRATSGRSARGLSQADPSRRLRQRSGARLRAMGRRPTPMGTPPRARP